jgi:hypothetical protein
MPVSVFSELPEIDGYEAQDELPVVVFRYAGRGVEQRAALQALARRRYSWPLRRTKTERATVDEFLRLRNYSVEAFYVEDPHQYARTGVSLGTSVTSQTVFPLPTTGENSRDYAANDSHVVVYDDGTPVTVSAVGTDARTFTLASAPAAGSVMTCDYWAYRLVRLLEPPSWAALGPDWLEAVLRLQEVAQ